MATWMKHRYRIIIQHWTPEEGWRDYKVIDPVLPYFPIHFGMGPFTVGISRIWLGFSKRHTHDHFIIDLGLVKIMYKKE